jgi:hypothetical protein
LDVNIKIDGNISEITFEQFYFNDSDKPIETEYIFPAHKDAVLGKLEMRYKHKFVKAIVEEREAVQHNYFDKSTIGKTQPIPVLEEADLDIMRINLGEIPPKSEIVLMCTFYQQLAVEDLSWLLHIQAKIISKHLKIH